MEKRRMDNLGIETSLLGFGCMRFPILADGSIDEEQAEAMLDAAYAAGINYFDTAYNYHGGKSEGVVGKALEKYERDSYFIATKLPVWKIETQEEVFTIFAEQLERLKKDYVDFYLLHALNKNSWDKVKELHIIEACEELRKQGKIKYLGFSFHDSYEVFEEIINYHKWDFCQIQYNYMDTEVQAGDKGYELAEKLGIPMVIMEPVRGGKLAGFADDVNEKFYAFNPDASIASYALRWVGSHSNVKVILSGMSDMAQTQDNLKTFEKFNPLTEEEEGVIQEVVTTLRSRIKNACTGCKYCMPCPAGVNIAASFKVWNEYYMYGRYEAVKFSWEKIMREEEKPVHCVECGKCEDICPQHIQIRENLKQVQKELDEAKVCV